MGYFAPLTVFYYIASPLIYVLKAFLAVLLFFIAPILQMGRYTIYICWYPFHLLGKFVALYKFLVVAVIVGAAMGTCLHYFASFMIHSLRLEARAEEEGRGRSLAEYKREVKEQEDPLRKLISKSKVLARSDGALANERMDGEWAKDERGGSRNRSIPNTILEEEDSSEGGF
ncbi:MAG: hypothetical protein Q9163_001996 [Psora crenata]